MEKIKKLSEVTYDIENLPREWAAEEPQKIIDYFGRMRGYKHGSRGVTKMIQFKERVKLTNEHVDYWTAVKPDRRPGETNEEMRIRSDFQKALVKFRELVYQYPPKKNTRGRRDLAINTLWPKDETTTEGRRAA